MKGCCFFIFLKPCGDGDGPVGGVGEYDAVDAEEAIFGFLFVLIQISQENFSSEEDIRVFFSASVVFHSSGSVSRCVR